MSLTWSTSCPASSYTPHEPPLSLRAYSHEPIKIVLRLSRNVFDQSIADLSGTVIGTRYEWASEVCRIQLYLIVRSIFPAAQKRRYANPVTRTMLNENKVVVEVSFWYANPRTRTMLNKKMSRGLKYFFQLGSLLMVKGINVIEGENIQARRGYYRIFRTVVSCG